MKLKAMVMGLCILACASQAWAGTLVNNGSFEEDPALTAWTVSGLVLRTVAPPAPRDGTQQAILRTNSPDGSPVILPLVAELKLAAGLSTSDMNLEDLGLQNGSVIWQEISGTAGQEVVFEWNFLTSERDPAIADLNDFAFVVFDGQFYEIFSAFDRVTGLPFTADPETVPGFNATTGYLSSSTIGTFILPASGSARLAFGVGNAALDLPLCESFGDCIGESSALAIDAVELLPITSVPEPASVLLLGAGLLGLTLWRRRRARQ